MAGTKTTKKAATTKKPERGTSSSTIWTDEERAAMQEHAKEMKLARSKKGKVDGTAEVQAKIAELPPEDRALAERIHAIVLEAAPQLTPRTYYGMPAYANESNKVVCFFTPASKFKERYSSFGFNPEAHLDDGRMWPTSWAVTEVDDEVAKRLTALVKKAVS